MKRCAPTLAVALAVALASGLGCKKPRPLFERIYALDAVGIRLKGHRSLRKLGAKSSFKIQLDRFEKKRKLAKQTTITLNNMVEDASLMREVLAYRLYRALGVAAPNAGFAEVVLDGEPQGMYAVIESIDKKFLKARFPNPDGPI